MFPLSFALWLVAVAVSSFPVDVFTPGEGGVAQFRIPALTKTSKGTLVAFSEARTNPATDCAYKWIVARRSTDNGTSWGPLINVVGDEWGRWATGNVQPFFHAASKRIVAIVGSKDLSTHGGCEPSTVVFALDDGGTDGLFWGPPRNISGALAVVKGGSTLLPGPGTGLVLTKSVPGRILAVGLAGGAYASEAVFWSDDGGFEWSVSPVEIGPGMDEANLAELENGQIYLSMRNSVKYLQAYALSSDAGATWGPINYDPALISPICEGSTATYGGALYFANPADRVHRANITVRRTAPGGAPTEWLPSAHLVAPGLTWGAYTAMANYPVTELEGGILFERNTTDNTPAGCVISFATFPLDF